MPENNAEESSVQHFSILAHVKKPLQSGGSADETMTTSTGGADWIANVRDYFEQRFQEECNSQFWKEHNQKLEADVLKQLLDDESSSFPTTPLSSKTPDTLRFHGSLGLRVTPEGGVIINLTRISLLMTINSSDDSKWELSDNPKSLRKLAWWERPVWAWTWHERLFTQAAVIVHDFVDQFSSGVCATIWNSNDAHQVNVMIPTEQAAGAQVRLVYTPPTFDAVVVAPNEKNKVANEGFVESKAEPREELGEQLESNLEGCVGSCVSATTKDDAGETTTNDFELHTQDESQQPTVVSFASQEIAEDGSQDASSSSPVQLTTSITALYSISEVTPDAKDTASQIDSHGINLYELSQLPADVRSEVRLVAAIQERQKKKESLKSSIRRWFGQSETTTAAKSGWKRKGVKSSKEKPQSKKHRTIQEFLGGNDPSA